MLQKPTELFFLYKTVQSHVYNTAEGIPLPLLNPYMNPTSTSPTIVFPNYPAVHWKGGDSSGFLGGEEKL